MRYFLFAILMILSAFSFSQVKEKNVMLPNEPKSLKNIKALTGNNYDIFYHRFVWHIDPAIRYISGSVTSYFNITKNNTSFLTFNLTDSLSVDSVVFAQTQAVFTHNAGVITVFLPDTFDAGYNDSVTVFYGGVPPQANESFYCGTHDTVNHVPIISTLSEPYGAMDWWPGKQTLDDKIDSIDIFIETPSQYTAVANGLLVSTESSGNNSIYHWKHRYPITPYLIGITITNYQLFTVPVVFPDGDTLPVVNYVYPENYDLQNYLGQFIDTIFRYFHYTIGKYPFSDETYGHAQWEFHGGMEHQTICFINTLDQGLMVHELAHQWFGDMITCGSWHDIWLNEGFATYFTVNYFYNDPYWYNLIVKEKINHVCSQSDGSVYVEDTTDVGRIFNSRLSYSKGGMVLHMLRWEIGDSAFFSAIHNYLADSGLIYNFAYTHDFLNHLEAVADTSLDEFFNDWVYGQGYPQYNINWQQNAGGVLSLKINQNPSHNSVDFFEMHLPLKIYGNGTDTLVRVFNNMQSQEFLLDIGFDADSIVFDPDNWIVTKNPQIQKVDEVKKDNVFRLYPIPASDKLYYSFPIDIFIDKVVLIRPDGTQAKTFYLPWKNEGSINVKGLSAGHYTAVFYSGKFRFSRAVEIVRN